MKHDEPLDLSALHTEVPLRDSDYAAIRARVRAELTERRQRSFFPLFMRFAIAAIVVALIAVLLIPRKREGSQVAVAPTPIAIAPTPIVIAPTPPPVVAERPIKPRVNKRKPKEPAAQLATLDAPMRIELQTADPDIRIIWIVQPNPEIKENS